MARNITVIYDSIIDYKKSREELNDLNSTSETAIYKLWAYIVSVAIFTHELLFDLHVEEVNTTLDSRINGTNDWYVGEALKYQDGDELVLLENGTRVGYNPVIEGNRTITRCAYFEDLISFEGQLNLKMAKGTPDNLSELTVAEEGRVASYFERIKFAGTNINIISIQADEILLNNITVFHDDVRTDDEVREDVETAMNNFLISLPFDGIFYIESFRDAIQLVDNVVDVEIVELERESWITGSPVQTVISRKVTLDAGYAKIQDFAPLNVQKEV